MVSLALGIHILGKALVAIRDGRNKDGEGFPCTHPHDAVGGLNGDGALVPMGLYIGVVGFRVSLLIGLAVDDVDGRNADVVGITQDLHRLGRGMGRD